MNLMELEDLEKQEKKLKNQKIRWKKRFPKLVVGAFGNLHIAFDERAGGGRNKTDIAKIMKRLLDMGIKANDKRKKIAEDLIARAYADGDKKCDYCKITLGATFHIDHKKSKILGGDHGENLCYACQWCNLEKSKKDENEWHELGRWYNNRKHVRELLVILRKLKSFLLFQQTHLFELFEECKGNSSESTRVLEHNQNATKDAITDIGMAISSIESWRYLKYKRLCGKTVIRFSNSYLYL